MCVSVKGDTRVDKGESGCVSDETLHAVAFNGSEAVAIFDSRAQAVNDSEAIAVEDCTATAHNGALEVCP